ncbi:g5554 [Coccomyxa elongata]
MARLLFYASVPPLTTNSLGPSVAPLSPAPLLLRLGMNVFIGLAMGGLVLVGLLLALARLFYMNKLEEAQLAEAAAGAAAGEAPAEAACAKNRLQRATPVVVIQPDREICYGRKEQPHCVHTMIYDMPWDLQISAHPIAQPQQPSSGAIMSMEDHSVRAFYVVEIL